MNVQYWTDLYPIETAPARDDAGWGILLETQFGNYRIVEKFGALEVQCSNGTISLELRSANTFGININQKM